MPTEDIQGILPRKVFFKGQEGSIKELATYESKEENNDDALDAMRYALDAMRYAVESMTEGEMSRTIELSKDNVRQILKMYGLERITKKRFKKLLMGCGIQRNDAELLAKSLSENRIRYTPLVVQSIFETIMEETEKEKI